MAVVLRGFFEGQVDAKTLSADLAGSVERGRVSTRVRIEDMKESFTVRTDGLVRLCDSILADEIDVKHLETIGFCIVASDAFEFDTDTEDGELVNMF